MAKTTDAKRVNRWQTMAAAGRRVMADLLDDFWFSASSSKAKLIATHLFIITVWSLVHALLFAQTLNLYRTVIFDGLASYVAAVVFMFVNVVMSIMLLAFVASLFAGYEKSESKYLKIPYMEY